MPYSTAPSSPALDMNPLPKKPSAPLMLIRARRVATPTSEVIMALWCRDIIMQEVQTSNHRMGQVNEDDLPSWVMVGEEL